LRRVSDAGRAHAADGVLMSRMALPDFLASESVPSLAPAVARIGASSAVDVHWTSFSELAADLDGWGELTLRALEPNVFLDPAFALPASQRFGRRLGVIAARASGRLVGLMPGRIEGFGHGRPVSTFVAWTHAFAPLSTPLIDRELAPETVAAMLGALPRLPHAPQVALFPLLPDEGAVAQLIALHLRAGGRRMRRFARHMRASLTPGEGDGIGMLASKKQKDVRRQRRRLAELGTFTHTVARKGEEIQTAVGEFLALEARGWKGRAGVAASSDDETKRFFTEAVIGLAAEQKARIDLLKLERETIAATVTLTSRDYAWFWKTTYDERFSRYSPGVLLALDLSDVLDADLSLSLVDSCAAADHPMMDQLWGGRIAMADWLVPLGGTAPFATAIATERLRRGLLAPFRLLRG
jgi:CelD/BcsL family acetyltransferase involved in cellulose biosynthesis